MWGKSITVDAMIAHVTAADRPVTIEQIRDLLCMKYDTTTALVAKLVEDGVFRRVYQGTRTIGVTNADRVEGRTAADELRQLCAKQIQMCPACDGSLGKRPSIDKQTAEAICYSCTRVLYHVRRDPKVLASVARYLFGARWGQSTSV